jgi:predicted nucleic acid-binding protein
VVVDSSGWVEYFGEGPKAASFEPYLQREGDLLLPTIVLYEVFKKLLATRSELTANRFLSAALRQDVVAFDGHLALAAVEVSLKYRLAMADAIIFATASLHGAELVTSDHAFQGLPGVTLV